MLDIKKIRHEKEHVEARLKSRDASISLDEILALDERIRQIKVEDEELKARKNALSREIGDKKRAGENADAIMEEANTIAEKVSGLDHELRSLEETYHDKLSRLPNIPLDDVQAGEDPADNVLLKEHGKKPNFGFTPKNHLELNEELDLFDFKRGAKISGTGWPVYSGMGARLEWALIRFMMDHHVERGFTPYMLPLCVRPEIMYGSGQLPKFADQAFQLTDDDHTLFLIPTAEVPLNGLFANEILPAEDLPKKFVAYSPCFRREAGAAGAQERGLIRVHQFNKVEMFAFAKPDQSEEVFMEMVESAEQIIEALGLHYRRMGLVTGDLGVAAARTYDIEVWLPGQDRYYEVSSVSLCTDYQARRSKIRYKHGQDKPELVHTLNGSGLATSRLMVALLENNQQEDGSVIVPPALSNYLGGLECLIPEQ